MAFNVFILDRTVIVEVNSPKKLCEATIRRYMEKENRSGGGPLESFALDGNKITAVFTTVQGNYYTAQ